MNPFRLAERMETVMQMQMEVDGDGNRVIQRATDPSERQKDLVAKLQHMACGNQHDKLFDSVQHIFRNRR